jgi:hypothetical protein
MDEIKDLLDNFGKDGYVSPEESKIVADTVKLLVAKVEELEARIKAIEGV